MAQNGQLHLTVLTLKEALAARPDLDLKIAIQQQEILTLSAQKERQAARIIQLEKIQAKALQRLQKARKIARMRFFANLALRFGVSKKAPVQPSFYATTPAAPAALETGQKPPHDETPASTPVASDAPAVIPERVVQAIQVLGTGLAANAKSQDDGKEAASPAITTEDDEVRVLQEQAALKALRLNLEKQLSRFNKMFAHPLLETAANRIDKQAQILQFAAMMADYTARLEGDDNVIDAKIKQAGSDESLLLGMMQQRRRDAVRERILPF